MNTTKVLRTLAFVIAVIHFYTSGTVFTRISTARRMNLLYKIINKIKTNIFNNQYNQNILDLRGNRSWQYYLHKSSPCSVLDSGICICLPLLNTNRRFDKGLIHKGLFYLKKKNKWKCLKKTMGDILTIELPGGGREKATMCTGSYVRHTTAN